MFFASISCEKVHSSLVGGFLWYNEGGWHRSDESGVAPQRSANDRRGALWLTWGENHHCWKIHAGFLFSQRKNIRKEIRIVRIMRIFIQFVRNQWTCRRKKDRIHFTIQKSQRSTSSSQNLESNYNFDLNLHWMMMLRYTYDGTSSSGKELKISEQQNSVVYLDIW
jgi:hypothetical protein